MKPRVVRTSVIVTIPEKNIMDLPQRDGHIDAIESGTTESRWVSQRLRRPVVKAFNNITAQHLLDSRRLRRQRGPYCVAHCGRRRCRQSCGVLAAATRHAGLGHGPRCRRDSPRAVGGEARSLPGLAGYRVGIPAARGHRSADKNVGCVYDLGIATGLAARYALLQL